MLSGKGPGKEPGKEPGNEPDNKPGNKVTAAGRVAAPQIQVLTALRWDKPRVKR